MIRYEFVDSSIREEDIHPDFIFDRERKLAHDFVTKIKVSGDIQPCPVCGTSRDEILFEKLGCQYAICPKTWAISLGSLPDEEVLLEYYHHSELFKFRASREYQDAVSQKRKDLWENQISWIEGRVSRHMGNDKYVVIDWGSRLIGWVDFVDTASFVDRLFVQEPLPPISESTDIDEKVDIVVLFNVLQRESQPQVLLKRIAQKLKPGGLLITSCRAGSGFDILTLRENSESIFPFDHIFLPSPKSMHLLLEQAGFVVLELTTPGFLDMKYVEKAKEDIPKDQHFQRYIMDQGDEFFSERMQGFLQRNNLSSLLNCVAKVK
ncbi:MAG: methyltransferase domain-containing protein [Deltaproteobacteria bacterium]|nr:methyltransferase domain-containing protein [Deltaproteobacteria bacterium]